MISLFLFVLNLILNIFRGSLSSKGVDHFSDQEEPPDVQKEEYNQEPRHNLVEILILTTRVDWSERFLVRKNDADVSYDWKTNESCV